MRTPLYKRRSPSLRVALVGLATVLVTAACGSTSGSGSAGEVSPAASAGVDQAKQILAQSTQRPTAIPVTTPLSKPVPRGKRLTFISCGTSSCNLESDIIRGATDALGWSLDVINTNGSPEQVKSAWAQVVRDKPDGVLYTAQQRAAFETELQQAKASGIAVAACCTVDPAENGIDFVINGPWDNEPLGQVMAAYVTANSGGNGKAVYVDLPVFPILTSLKSAFMSHLTQLCPGCQADTLDIPLSAIGKDAPDKIVSYLRSHSDVKYVLLSTDSIGLGLPAALKAAGLSSVRTFGEGPDTTTLQYIKTGQRDGTLAFPYYEDMYAMIDAVIRKIIGDPIPQRLQIPLWLLNKDNIPATDQLFPLVADAKEQYFKLWGVG